MKRTNRSRAPARRPSTQRRPVSTGTGMGAKLLIMAAVVAAVVFGVAIFFKVGRVEVQGNTIYSSEKIMEASGLELGDNLLTVSRARVAGNVKAALPYVDQVSVGRVLPDTVVISVKESQLVFAAQTDTNTVWLISPSGKALERIDALCETNDRTAVRRYCANETVNIALSSLSADINAHGITADLRAAVPETVHVSDVDLFSVVSNALDNAIAAASTAPEDKRFVDLDLRYEDGQLLLLVSNTFGRAPHMVDGMPVAQHTGHGFGTKSIKLAVERMNGNCQFRINGDRFELRAVM